VGQRFVRIARGWDPPDYGDEPDPSDGWHEAVRLFPKHLQRLLGTPRPDVDEGSGEVTVTMSADAALSEDSGVELTARAWRGEDADEDGPYSTSGDDLEYTLWADTRSWSGSEVGRLKQHLREFEHYLATHDPAAHDSFMSKTAVERPKYPDGRLIPQPGDEVYQMVRGFGGMAASLVGVVSPSGKTVKITGGGDLISHAPRGKSYRMSEHWTVVDDPSVKARAEARKQKQLEEDAKKKLFEQKVQEMVEHEARKRGLHRVRSTAELKPGDQVYSISAWDPSYEGDPANLQISMREESVHEIYPKWFTYLNEHGSELTSGKPELWWTK